MDKINSAEISLILAMLFAIASFHVQHGSQEWLVAMFGALWYFTVTVIRTLKSKAD